MIKHNEYWFVTDDLELGKPSYYFIGTDYQVYANHGQLDIPMDIHLPPGTYQLIGRAAELTEEQWGEIVEVEKYFKIKWQSCYKNYDVQMGFGFSVIKTATASGHSLLRSHNLKPETTIVLKTMPC